MATLMIGDVMAADPGTVESRATVSDDTDVHRLICSRHKINPLKGDKCVWCPHMKRLITSGADSKQIDAITEPTYVTVPLRPTENVWASVLVEGLHTAGMHEVALPLLTEPPSPPTSPTVAHLGVIARGEGRNAIRLILFDYLAHAYETVGPCTARIHVGNRFKSGVPREPESTALDLMDTYSILTTGMCTTCAPYANFDDDIPDI